MKKFYTFLLATSLTFITQFGFSQEPLKLTLQTLDSMTVQNGLVDVDVRVSDFENLIAVQYAIVWDSTVLEIQGISYVSPDLSGLAAGSFALPEQTNMGIKGRLLHTWNALDALPKDLPDDHLLFTMRFKAIGAVCDVTDFGIQTGPGSFVSEVYTNDLVDVGLEMEGPTVLVTGPGCNGFVTTLACNDFVNVSLSPWSGSTTLSPDMILEGGPYNYDNMTISPTTVDCDDIGNNVLVTVTDTTTNNSCWGEVSVADKVPPVVILESELVVTLSSSGSANPFTAVVSVDQLDDGSYDNCSDVASMTFEPASFTFDCTDLGEQQAVVTVTDEYGNSNSAFTTIIVEVAEQLAMICPPNVVVDCDTDITSPSVIVNQLGAATTSVGCVPTYNDVYGYDQNQDGDKMDEYIMNGETISEEYYFGCGYGTVVRSWSVPGSASSCVQFIGLKNVGSSFDGATMIDWPYSKDAIAAVESNDGASCVICPVDANNIELVYDNDGNAIGSNVEIGCDQGLCEIPAWVESTCSLIGYASEEVIGENADGFKTIEKTYYVIDACQYDSITGNGRWSWTVNAVVNSGVPEGVGLVLNDVAGSKGETVCVPLRVYDFENIESIQGSINWDPTVAQFGSIENFGLSGLSSSSFGISNVSQGKLSFAWYDETTLNPATLQDGSALFEVCFNVVGEEGESTLIEVTSDPTLIELTSMEQTISYNITQGSLIVGESNCDMDVTSPVPYCVGLTTVLLDDGQVELWAIDFNAGSFDNCTASDDLRYTFSNVLPDNDPNFIDISSSMIFTQADIPPTGAFIPLNIYVWDENNNYDYCSVNLELKEDPETSETVRFRFDQLYGRTGDILCQPLKVENFIDIEAVQGTISFDPDVISYAGVQSPNLPGFSAAANLNEGSVANGLLPFVWFDNSGANPVTLSNGTALFEVCFELVGDEGDVSTVKLVNSPTLIQVSGSGSMTKNYGLSSGQVAVVDPACTLMVTNIAWPTMDLTVFVDDVTSTNISTKMSPGALVQINGVDSTDVYPQILLDEGCNDLIGEAYQDIVFELGDGNFKIIRTWTLLDWYTLQVFSFEQTIVNYTDEGLICDFLPNSAPLGDCGSGHTDEDDIEWPDDLAITDHRISPDELHTVLGVDLEDTRPVLVSNAHLYRLEYVDLLGELSEFELIIDREWTLSRVDIIGQEWTYIQEITVDLTDFGKLVTVNTTQFRPVPDVIINSSAATDNDGVAYTEDDVNPSRSDEARNGLNIRDMMLIRQHILGIEELDSFELFAADINEDMTLTSLDFIELERVILGFENSRSTEWKFIDQTEETSLGYSPKAHYLAFKPGDVDDSADLGFNNDEYDSETLVIEDRLLNAGEVYEVPMFISGNIEAMATELHLIFDEQKVEVTNVSSEQSFEMVSFNIINGNRLSMVTRNDDLGAQVVDSVNAFITLEIKALENGTLKNVFGISDVNSSFILDSEMELVLIDGLFENEISTSADDIILDDFSVYPNPADQFVIIDCENCSMTGPVVFEIYSMDGKKLIQSIDQQQVELTGLTSGMYIYRILTSEGIQTGRLFKAQN